MASKKLTISLDESVIIKLDEYAKEVGISRSGAIAFLVAKEYEKTKNLDLYERIADLKND